MMLLRRRRSRMLMLLRSCRPGAQQQKNPDQSGHGPRDPRVNPRTLPSTSLRPRQRALYIGRVGATHASPYFADSEVLDAKRCLGGAWIERCAALGCPRDRRRGNRWRDEDRRRWRYGYGNRIQPGIDDRERNITRLVAQHATRDVDGNTLRRAVMLVTRRLRRGRCALMMAGDRAGELARGDDHGWSHEDQHQQPGDEARQHRVHRNTHESRPAKAGPGSYTHLDPTRL